MKLTDYASNTYSQFGEDGCIAHIFEKIEPHHKPIAVEFGAGDGIDCSNTARLWRENGWFAYLIEPEPARFELLEGNAGPFDTRTRRGFVTPAGTDSISEMLGWDGIDYVDFMSIDVDGDDYFILEALTIRPTVICIEFNPTIPPHIEARQERPGGTLGASLLSLVRAGERLGYRFVGATYCNAFLVIESEAAAFEGYETDPARFSQPGDYTYAVTDFNGRLVLVGQAMPWMPTDPYVLPVVSSAYVTAPTTTAQTIRRGFEALWGPVRWMTLSGVNALSLGEILDKSRQPVCIDLTNQPNLDDIGWVWMVADQRDYSAVLNGRVLGLNHR